MTPIRGDRFINAVVADDDLQTLITKSPVHTRCTDAM